MSRLVGLARRLAGAVRARLVPAPTRPPFGALAAVPRRPVRRLLVTGAAGGVATMLRPMLTARYPVLRLSDVRSVRPLAPTDEIVRADLADRRALRRAMRGCDAVLHLGGVAKEASYDAIAAANLGGIHHLLDLAVAERVPRVVLASTMHVVGMYGRDEPLAPAAPPRPDSLYAVSKLFAEQMARLFADKYGLEVACLRIGSVGRRHEETEPGAWIGPEDLFALVALMLEHPDVRYEVVAAVAPHDGDAVGQEDVARRFGMRWAHPGPSYRAAMAAVDVHFAHDPIARSRRGGVFASATAPMV